jgi:tetratricopeptide (TPR) repeat protein
VRLLRYLGFWWVPLTAYTAIDMPEPALAGLPAVLAVAGVVLLLALLAWLLVRKHSGPVRAAAIGAGCTLALYLPQLLWPRLAAPFALPASYAFMLPALLLPACLAALLPLRAGWSLGACALLAWLAVAADTLQTFSTHIALWDDAVRRVERTGRAPQDARVYINRATLHRSQGHTLAALADFDTALGLQPDSPRALRGRAQVYVDEKRYGEALRDLDRLLELEPEQAITHADRGMVLMQAGRYNEAGFAFDRAVAKGVKEPRVYLNRGLARLHQGGLSSAPAALIDIERAIALDPNYALAYYNRAMVFEQSANAGIRLRDALSPELMRAVASQNLDRACELGHAGACERQRAKAEQLVPGEEAPLGVKPEALREKGLPAR